MSSSSPRPNLSALPPRADSVSTTGSERGAFQVIVLATDDMAHSAREYSVATAFAKAFGARLHVLVVMPIHGEFEYAYTPWAPALVTPESDEEKRHYREIATRVSERAQREGARWVTSEMLVGQPAPTILSASEEARADLVVLGACRPSSSRRIFLGSVSNAVASVSSLPVLVVRGTSPEGEEGRERGFDRIVAAIDGSPAAAEALRRAIAISRGLKVPLSILTVVPRLVGDGLRSAEARRREAHALSAAETLLAEGRKAASQQGVEELSTELLRGIPAEKILDSLGRSESHLLVVGSRGLSPTRGLILGSVSTVLLHHSPSSILIVRVPK